MNKKLTRQDWEALSAYVDQELSPREIRRLEKRLQSELHLLEAYHKLRRTKDTLRRAPRFNAPRNFTLTPEMVGDVRRKPAPRKMPVFFRTAAAFATVLLAVVLVFDFGSMMLNPRVASAPEMMLQKDMEEPQLEAAVEEEQPQPEAMAVEKTQVVEEEREAGDAEVNDALAEEESAPTAELAPSPAPLPAREPVRPETRTLSTLRQVEIILVGLMVVFGGAALLTSKRRQR